MKTTVGELLINQALPKSLQDYSRVLTGRNIGPLMTEVATRYPQAYAPCVQTIKRVGDIAAYESAHSVSLNDFKPDPVRRKLIEEVETKATEISKTEKDPTKAQDKIVGLYDELRPKLEKAVLDAGIAKGSGLHEMVLAKSRGNQSQLNSIVGAKLIVRDSQGKPIMVPINNSFSEGLKSHEYWSDTYATRRGVLASKLATAEGGYLGKKLSTPLVDMIVTEVDCGTYNGILKDVTDKFVVDRFLCQDTPPYHRNDVVNPSMLKKLGELNYKKLKVRSPLTCEAEKGICARCYGLKYNGHLPQIGDAVGLQAAQTIAEPIAQSSLSEKHSGGVASKGALTVNFQTIKSFTEVPEKFPQGAVLAEGSGKVEEIVKAPQGGTFVTVADHKQYVPEERTVLVHVGDELESGDQISDGFKNPAEVVRLKGLGAGRKFFADEYQRLHNIAYDTNSDSRHYELYGRALVNQGIAEDIDEERGILPGDVIDYSYLSNKIDTSKARTLALDAARGKYFANATLHYQIGDLVDRTAIQDLKDSGIKEIKVLEERPPVTPILQRISEVSASNPDWMARLAGEGVMKSVRKAVTKGEISNIHGISPYPGLAEGVEFGTTGTKGEY